MPRDNEVAVPAAGRQDIAISSPMELIGDQPLKRLLLCAVRSNQIEELKDLKETRSEQLS